MIWGCDDLNCMAERPQLDSRDRIGCTVRSADAVSHGCTRAQATIYFCGLKGMMPGIQDMLERVAESKGMKWEEFLEKLKKNGQWRVEVY